ncbi:uncharacterized protein RCO7_06996 [Rhynchosporium graminicola]|uniref:Protein-S-isoprenylcysteine O-methyltransferase n=1 Tax=Rhynchosporium graminicola TaxID=2792576 RepID=A0A1E1K0M2_9HELO|nr:uncharacterized protein RCO7_06996 [Rhynchosporium commune]
MEIPELPTILLALIGFLASYLSMQCFTDPNSNTTASSTVQDRITRFTNPNFLLVNRIIVLAIGLIHALLILNPTTPNYLLCPKPSNLNLSLFTWTRHSSICLLLILIFAPLRLLAFAQLGENFTFKLDRPQNLVTSGVYAYVQHPSYTALAVVVSAHWMLFQRSDGVAGCWMSEAVARSQWWSLVGWGSVAGALSLVRKRVVDEERMLKETFGRQWEDWHRRTKRFVPGVI